MPPTVQVILSSKSLPYYIGGLQLCSVFALKVTAFQLLHLLPLGLLFEKLSVDVEVSSWSMGSKLSIQSCNARLWRPLIRQKGTNTHAVHVRTYLQHHTDHTRTHCTYKHCTYFISSTNKHTKHKDRKLLTLYQPMTHRCVMTFLNSP